MDVPFGDSHRVGGQFSREKRNTMPFGANGGRYTNDTMFVKCPNCQASVPHKWNDTGSAWECMGCGNMMDDDDANANKGEDTGEFEGDWEEMGGVA